VTITLRLIWITIHSRDLADLYDERDIYVIHIFFMKLIFDDTVYGITIGVSLNRVGRMSKKCRWRKHACISLAAGKLPLILPGRRMDYHKFRHK